MNVNSKWSLKKDVFLELDPDGKSGMLIDTTSSNYCSCNRTALLILSIRFCFEYVFIKKPIVPLFIPYIGIFFMP